MPSKAVAAATTHFLQFRIQYASIALLYWDYVLTLQHEIQYLWTRKSLHRLSTALYILCRYALVANVLYLLAVAGKLGSSCNTWYKFIGGISVVARAAVLTVFTMRTYAMWSKNKVVLCVLGVLALTCVALDCLHVPGLRCTGSLSIQISANTLLSILMCVFEFFTTVLTTFRCVQAVKAAGSLRSQRNTLTVMILEQGVLYFGIVTMLTIAAVILNFRAPSGFLQRLLNALILPVSGLLTARFLLHMRAWDNKGTMNRSAYSTTSTGVIGSQSDPAFAHGSSLRTLERSVVGEFGDDPVVFARSHGGTSTGETVDGLGVGGSADEEKWIELGRVEQRHEVVYHNSAAVEDVGTVATIML
ncbi:hypothetical protein BC835DRAFT_51765 [Cytidiella melzeri]|nr:hypothetical protein BC835DRAFT_51765 [Cytidiella melzeri]